MKKKIVLIVVISFVLIRCSYDFAPDNFIDLEQPITETDYINLVDFNNLDTINTQRIMRYDFQGIENQNTIESKVYIDNEQVSVNWEGQFGTFTLRPETYDDGVHNIRIEHTFSSGSGSIADQAGLETISEIASYQFVVNRFPSSPPSIISVEIIDGTIYVEWSTDYETDFTSAYLSFNFKTREVQIPLSNDELALGTYNDQSTVLFEGSSNTPNFDEYSSVSYSILFESDYESSYGTSRSLSYDPSSITMEVAFVDFDSYKLKWSAHPLYNNFENFEFLFGGEYFSGSSLGGEYVINSPYIFGKELTSSIRPGVSYPEIPLQYYSIIDTTLDDDTFGLANLNSLFVKEIIYHPSTNNFYALIIENRSGIEYYFRIYEYSYEMDLLRTSNLITYDNIRYEYLDITVNPDDNNIHIDARGSAYEMDVSTLQIINQYTDPPLTSELTYRGEILVRTDYSNNQLTITNTTSNTIVYSDPSNSARLGYLSNNGRYILIFTSTENKLYRIDSNQLVEVFDFSPISLSGIIEMHGDNLFYASGSEVFYLDLINNTSKSFSFGFTQQKLQFDSFSNKLLAYQSNQSAIYNILTDDIVRFQLENNKFSTGLFNQEDRNYFMRLWNDRLIHTKGIYIDLN